MSATTIPTLANDHLLGRSGLRVSPLCLGTMTFGTEWGWGSAEDTARAIFARYLEFDIPPVLSTKLEDLSRPEPRWFRDV